jgi:protein-S-isoprenylcysteine O-methyltransferase Ste14
MALRQRFERWMQFRFAVIYPFGIYVLLTAYPTGRSIRAGIGFVAAGILIRLWANCYAIKMDKLTTSGPYAFVRNPLYAGTILIAIGMVGILQVYLAGAFFLAILIAVYYSTIRKEERMLEEKFKGSYLDYKKHVRAMIPSIVPYRSGEKWPFSLERLARSKEYKTCFWIIIVIIIFYLKSEFLINHQKLNSRNAWLIAVALLLAFSDLAFEFAKARKRAKTKAS